MKILSTVAASAVALPLILFSSSSIAAPSQQSARLRTCVKEALIGKDAQNRIITPEDDRYTAASTGAILFSEFPALVVYATSVDEISPLVKCGSGSGYKITPRSGSSHFENWSALNGTLVIDVSHIDYVQPSSKAGTATVAAGAKMGTIYSLLRPTGQTFNGGLTPSVALGGYLGNGGYNMQMRYLGMAVDHIASARVILANGSLITASPRQNADLFWGMRGGGTFGFLVDAVINTVRLDRSAMVWMNFSTDIRAEATQKYLDWASRQDRHFNSQLNLYGSTATVLGWYAGKTADELRAIVEGSGLRDLQRPGGAQVTISGNCSSENSRNFWVGTQTECTDDATAHALFDSWFNVAPDDLAPVPGVTNVAFDDTPVLPDQPKARPWSRIALINKTYFITKAKPLTPAIVSYITSKSGALPAALAFWTEMTSFNISVPATGAFAWQEQATYLFRFQVTRSANNATLEAIGQRFMDDLDAYLLPKIGTASYSGYIDAHIGSNNPYTAYWGDNVCKLSQIKKRYDPDNSFTNPFQIGPTPPPGVKC